MALVYPTVPLGCDNVFCGEVFCIADFAPGFLNGGCVANVDHSQPDAFVELSSVGATPITFENQIRIDGQDRFGTWPVFYDRLRCLECRRTLDLRLWTPRRCALVQRASTQTDQHNSRYWRLCGSSVVLLPC